MPLLYECLGGVMRRKVMARLSNLQRSYSSAKIPLLMHSSTTSGAIVKDFDAKRTVDAVLDAPKQLQREWENTVLLVCL